MWRYSIRMDVVDADYDRAMMRREAAARVAWAAQSSQSRAKQFGAAHGSANCKRRVRNEAERVEEREDCRVYEFAPPGLTKEYFAQRRDGDWWETLGSFATRKEAEAVVGVGKAASDSEPGHSPNAGDERETPRPVRPDKEGA